MCIQHGHEIRQLLETKFQHVFNQIRDEYDQQCSHLLTTIERDINQMNVLLQDMNTKVESSPLIINDTIGLLTKHVQRLDVLTKNLEYDWQMITQTSNLLREIQNHVFPFFSIYLVDKFECENVLPSAPLAIPKADVTFKESRLMTIENKENFIETNLLPAPIPNPSRPVAISVIPCRPKNDVR